MTELEPTDSALQPASSRWRYPVRPEMTDRHALAVILERLVEVVLETEEGVAERRDVDFLHDYRVAVRRTRSALSLFGAALPSPLRGHGRRFFKDLGRRTNRARDLDVLLLALPEYSTGLSELDRKGLDVLTRRLAAADSREYSSIRRWLGAKGYRAGIDRWRDGLAELAASTGGSPFPSRAAFVLRKALSRSLRQIGDVGSAEALHRLRIRLKKLRYAAEFSRPVARGGEIDAFIATLKGLQNELGAFQDLAVHREMLAPFAAERKAPEVAQTAAELAHLLKARQDDARRAVLLELERFDAEAIRQLEKVVEGLD